MSGRDASQRTKSWLSVSAVRVPSHHRSREGQVAFEAERGEQKQKQAGGLKCHSRSEMIYWHQRRRDGPYGSTPLGVSRNQSHATYMNVPGALGS